MLKLLKTIIYEESRADLLQLHRQPWRWRSCFSSLLSETDFEAAVAKKIVSIDRSISLEMNEGDSNEHLKERPEELKTDNLKEVHTQQHMKILQEISVTRRGVISTSEMKTLFKWRTQKKKLEVWRRYLMTLAKHKQTSLDSFFFKSMKMRIK